MYVVIAGINILTRKLVKRLEGRHDVVVIEEDEEKCKRLYSSTGATVINKNPSSLSALEDAGITRADILLSVLKNDNENMVVCSLAKKYGVPKVVSRVEDDEYFDAFDIIDTQAIGHTDILVSEFLSAVEHPYIVKLADLPGDREILKAKIKKNSSVEGKTVNDIKVSKGFPESFAITSIIKSNEVKTAVDGSRVERGDRLILIGPEEDKSKLDTYFQSQ